MRSQRLKPSPIVATLLLVAFFPTLSFLGHWDEIFGGSVLGPTVLQLPAAAIFDAARQRTDQAEHAQHCHTALSSCSEQPMPAGVGLLITQEATLLPPSLGITSRVVLDATPRQSPSEQPLTPPPRAPSPRLLRFQF